MRIEPEYDSNPPKKFVAISSLNDLPVAQAKEVAGLYARIHSMIDELRRDAEIHESAGEVCNEPVDPVVQYIAFQEMQILSLQKEIGLIYKGMQEIAEVVDNQNPGKWDS